MEKIQTADGARPLSQSRVGHPPHPVLSPRAPLYQTSVFSAMSLPRFATPPSFSAGELRRRKKRGREVGGDGCDRGGEEVGGGGGGDTNAGGGEGVGSGRRLRDNERAPGACDRGKRPPGGRRDGVGHGGGGRTAGHGLVVAAVT